MLKIIAKKLIGRHHWDFLSWYRNKFGFISAIRAYVGLSFNGGIARAPNRLNDGAVFLRPGTTDQDVYDEVFLSREYDIDLGDPRFIIDAGAHIGLASVFFASRYPLATIIAVEPESSNFEILCMNAKGHPNIRPLRAGLWSNRTHLRIEDTNVETWSFRVLEDPSGEGIPAVGVLDILNDFEARAIDVLKIDIEGSEVEALKQSALWINNVRTIIIELHDRFRPGCTAALENALRDHSYSRGVSGESIVIFDLHLKPVVAAPAPRG